jgi:hypothetical protein
MEARASARWLIALVLGAAPVLVGAADRLTVEVLRAPGGFQRVELARLLGYDALATGLAVEIPSLYRPWESSDATRGAVMWSRLADFTRIRNGKRQSGRTGLLVAQSSDYVRYRARADEFRDETGLSERNMAQRLLEQGGTAIRVERVDRGGLPILLVEADLSHREKLRAFYFGIGRAGTRKLYYLPQQPWSEADALVWARLREGILNASLAASP